MEFDGALGDVELAGNFLVGEIFEQRIEDFLLTAAEIRDRVGFQAAALAGENGIDEARQNRAGNPETSLGNQRQSARQLIARFGIGEDTLHAEAKQREAIGLVQRVSNDNQAGFGEALENVGEQGAGSLASGVRINDIDLRARRFKVAQIGSERGFELLGNNFELGGLAQKALKFGEHERVR